MEFNILKIATYFIIYSFLGWVMESVFRSICERKLINTGFLRGPICPIYGIGAIIMILVLNNFKSNILVLFLIGITVLTAWEYIVGYLLEKIFKTKYWDYSDHKFNFQGRICLTNSIYWGVLGVVFVKYIHPFIQNLINQIDINILKYVTTICMVIFVVDTITTIVKFKNIKATLEKVEALNKEIKEKIKEIPIIAKEKEFDKLKYNENIQNIIEELKNKRNKIILKLYKNVYRLKKAFQAINTKEITEVLNKKIELRKKAKKDCKKH